MSMSFRYFKCGGGLNPTTREINGTVFVICANVPGQGEASLSGGELAGIIVGTIAGAFLLVLLVICLRRRCAMRRFEEAIHHQQNPREFLTPTSTRPAQPGVPSNNVVPMTPEEIARMQV